MFDHLPFDQTNKSKEGLVRTFILKNLDIPLKVSCTVGNKKKRLLSSSSTFQFNTDKRNNPYSEEAGCYLFFLNSTLDQYIGSSINIKTRFIGHRDSFSSSKKQKTLRLYRVAGGLKHFSFGTIYLCPNFYNLFINAHPLYTLSTGEYNLLMALTQLMPRILEQSLLNAFNSELNGENSTVLFSYNKFDLSIF